MRLLDRGDIVNLATFNYRFGVPNIWVLVLLLEAYCKCHNLPRCIFSKLSTFVTWYFYCSVLRRSEHSLRVHPLLYIDTKFHYSFAASQQHQP